MHYADHHLGKFLDSAKKTSWYDSTLIIISADHSHHTIKQWESHDAAHAHIPILFLGGAIKPEWRGKNIDRVVSQLDIVHTVLKQMKIDTKPYVWSRDMLNPYTPASAFFIFYGGAGYITQEGYASIYQQQENAKTSFGDDSLKTKSYIRKARAFEQVLYSGLQQKQE